MKKLIVGVLVAVGCATSSSTSDDASVDDSSVKDATTNDSTADAHPDVTTDAATDADDASDATTPDADQDAADDAASDAGVDADDSGPPIDAGKGCKGVFCIKGDTCCNLVTSKNYGKCESTLCLACCM